MFTAFATLALLLAADPVSIKLDKEADKSTIATADDRTTISIESESGIGTAVLRPGKDGWPKALRLDLNLKGLEGFTLHDGSLVVRTFLGAKMPDIQQLRDEKWERVDLDLEVAPVIRKEGKRIHINIPPAWLDAKRKDLRIQWVDFYR